MSGKPMGDYELLEKLAGGGQATVHKARHIPTGDWVAVKLLHAGTDDEAAERRFQREAEILRRIDHPNIVRYRDSFVCESEWGETQHGLVMELLEGETLKDLLRRHPMGIPLKKAKDILRQCIEGLICSFEKHGITHRDIKPSNFFILRDGTVKLIDFGIARVEEDVTVTTANTGWMGSFDYMAPDFVSQPKGTGNQASDIFSLTVCFYEALTGRLPFPKLGEQPELEYFERWSGKDDVPPSHAPVAFRVVQHLTAFIDKGLKIDPGQRYASYREMLAALEKLQPRIIRRDSTDGYELLEGLGKGGFGEVYKARHLQDDKIVAIKRLFADRSTDRFLKEAQILQKYRHPHLVQYVDSFKSDTGSGECFFIVLEYLDGMPGMSLRERILESPDGLDPAEMMRVFSNCLLAMEYLHRHGIIHRDIKPGNLYVPAGKPENGKILDFGVARDMEGTKTQGMIPGTWDYMAPEFILDESRGTAQSDIYAVGLTLYEAVTGKPAFPRITGPGHKAITEFVARAAEDAKIQIDFSPAPFQQFPDLVTIIRRATHREPARRFESAAQMRTAILALLQKSGADISMLEIDRLDMAAAEKLLEPSSETGFSPRGKGRRHRTVLAVSLGILSSLAFLAGAIWIGHKPAASTGPNTPPTTHAPIQGPTAGPVQLPAQPPAHPSAQVPAQPPAQPPDSHRSPAQPAPDPESERLRLEQERVRTEAALRLANRNLQTEQELARKKDIEAAVQMMTMQSAVGLDLGSFDTAARDARRRAATILTLHSRLPSDEIRRAPEVGAELKRFYSFLARESAMAFNTGKPRDPRFLAIARGALLAALPLYDNSDRPDILASIVNSWNSHWNKERSALDLTRLLPFPSDGDIRAVPAFSNPAIAPFTADSPLKSARILPHATTLLLSRSDAGRTTESPVRLCLVPDGAGRRSSSAHPGAPDLKVAAPFYLAATETTIGMMRAYRAGAAEALARDPTLARRFTGRVGGIALESDPAPYAKTTGDEAIEFCNWLSIRNHLPPVYTRQPDASWHADLSQPGFRLPLCTEWEYAARYGIDWSAPTNAPDWKRLTQQLSQTPTDDRIWFYYKKAPRSTDAPDAWSYPLGIRDLSGNVGEFCAAATPDNAPTAAPVRLLVCGGSFKSKSAREIAPDSAREYVSGDDDVGFRILLPMPIEDLRP